MRAEVFSPTSSHPAQGAGQESKLSGLALAQTNETIERSMQLLQGVKAGDIEENFRNNLQLTILIPEEAAPNRIGVEHVD